MPPKKASKQSHESTAQSSAKKPRADDAETWRNIELDPDLHEDNSSEVQEQENPSSSRDKQPENSRKNDNTKSLDPISVSEHPTTPYEAENKNVPQNVPMTGGNVLRRAETVERVDAESKDIEILETEFDILRDLQELEEEFKTDINEVETRLKDQMKNLDEKYSSRFNKIKSHLKRQGKKAEPRTDSPIPSQQESCLERRENPGNKLEILVPPKQEAVPEIMSVPVTPMGTPVQPRVLPVKEAISPTPSSGGLMTRWEDRIAMQRQRNAQLRDGKEITIPDQEVGFDEYGWAVDKRTTPRSTWD